MGCKRGIGGGVCFLDRIDLAEEANLASDAQTACDCFIAADITGTGDQQAGAGTGRTEPRERPQRPIDTLEVKIIGDQEKCDCLAQSPFGPRRVAQGGKPVGGEPSGIDAVMDDRDLRRVQPVACRNLVAHHGRDGDEP